LSSEAGSRIAKNSIFNLARTLLTIPITLLITPFIINHVGKEQFGIWAFVGIISSYVQLSDFGITESMIKFIAEFKAREDSRQINLLINTAFTVYVAISIVLGTIVMLALPFIVNTVLRIPPELASKAIYVFMIAIILFLINMTMGVFGSLIVGYQRMGYSNLISLISTIIMACGTFILLSKGYGLEGLIHNNALITLFVIVSNASIAWRLFPEMRLNPFRYFNRETLKLIFGFSWKVQLSSISNLLVYQVDRVLLSHYLGLAAVGNYEVANRIATQARVFIASVFTPMTPAASALQAADEFGKLRGLYNRSMKYMAVAAIPFSFLIIALAHPFVKTWLGAGYTTSAYTMQFLMLAYMINLLPGPGNFILQGMNKPHIPMVTSIGAGILNLILCFLLVQMIGYYGVIIGIFSSITLSGLVFVFLVHRSIEGLSWGLYGRILLKPFAVSATLAGLLALLGSIIPFNGYLILCLVAVVYCFLVMVVMLKGKYFDDFDRATLSRLNPMSFFR
jgi:O-antigen/teichoic acid export membrane protein